ncbi:MAG: DeoR family transcriptional regulator [Candidatus Pacebacteria bacterium]|nr:DeoR family transcriptional regulator [Candidatus Paceibacterota bacterium]
MTCNDVEKLLDVSGATARKYLNELEDEAKITQIGKSGKDVYYTLKTSEFSQN